MEGFTAVRIPLNDAFETGTPIPPSFCEEGNFLESGNPIVMSIQRENMLYPPVKAYFRELGYTVRGEVNGCDLVAMRDDQLIIVELKRTFNLDLVFQAMARQRLTDLVYVAVEAPRRRQSRWRHITALCKRLGLGLITVSFVQARPRVAVELTPGDFAFRRQHGKRTRLIAEFERRSGDWNVGGSNRRPVVTVYREQALLIAAHLAAHGPCRARDVREATGVAQARDMLYRNVYGWFERVAYGIYGLTEAGQAALAQFAEVIRDRADR